VAHFGFVRYLSFAQVIADHSQNLNSQRKQNLPLSGGKLKLSRCSSPPPLEMSQLFCWLSIAKAHALDLYAEVWKKAQCRRPMFSFSYKINKRNKTVVLQARALQGCLFLVPSH